MVTNPPNEPANQPMYYDADYAPPGATNVLNHGWEVIDASGQHIGSVDQVYGNYVSIAEGYIIHDLVYAPFSAIDHVDVKDEQVFLNVTQQQMVAQGWHRMPDDIDFGSASRYVVGPTGEIYPNETPQQVERMRSAQGAPGAEQTGGAARPLSGTPGAAQAPAPGTAEAPAAGTPETVEVTIVEEVIELGAPEAPAEGQPEPPRE